MSEQRVEFRSDGLTIRGVLALPDSVAPETRCAAFVVLHGFGSNMNAGNVREPCKLLGTLGYATLRFDMRGCGESGGEPGRLICLEQVEDTRNAVSFMAGRPEINPACIALIGSSFGAAVALYSAGVDARIAAVVSVSGWGHGERKFRGQHNAPGAYAKFLAMLEEGRRHRERTGTSLMVPRYEIVPIPEALRGHLAQRSVQMFPAETAQSMFDFKAEEQVAQIAPRPLLLLHSASDSVTPVEQSVELYRRARQPCELHLFADTDHFMLAESNPRVRRVLTDWLGRYFAANASD